MRAWRFEAEVGETMKQRVLERARSTVDAVLRKHCADTTLEVLRMYPEEGSYGDEVLLIIFKYDDSEHAKPLPDASERIRLHGHLHTELQEADVDAFPVVSYFAESEIEEEPA